MDENGWRPSGYRFIVFVTSFTSARPAICYHAEGNMKREDVTHDKIGDLRYRQLLVL